MNEEQRRAVLLAESGHSFFLTGGIGTGKTTTVRSIVHSLNRNGKNVAVTASTGLASQQILGT